MSFHPVLSRITGPNPRTSTPSRLSASAPVFVPAASTSSSTNPLHLRDACRTLGLSLDITATTSSQQITSALMHVWNQHIYHLHHSQIQPHHSTACITIIWHLLQSYHDTAWDIPLHELLGYGMHREERDYARHVPLLAMFYSACVPVIIETILTRPSYIRQIITHDKSYALEMVKTHSRHITMQSSSSHQHSPIQPAYLQYIQQHFKIRSIQHATSPHDIILPDGYVAHHDGTPIIDIYTYPTSTSTLPPILCPSTCIDLYLTSGVYPFPTIIESNLITSLLMYSITFHRKWSRYTSCTDHYMLRATALIAVVSALIQLEYQWGSYDVSIQRHILIAEHTSLIPDLRDIILSYDPRPHAALEALNQLRASPSLRADLYQAIQFIRSTPAIPQ